MKTIYYLVIMVYSCCEISVAYPLDYDESSVEKTEQALNELRVSILEPSFSSILDKFQDQIAPIGLNIYDKISKIHESYSNRLTSIENDIENTNTNISDCMETKNLPEADYIYLQYESECEEVTTNLGKNVISYGSSKQVVFLQKYEELTRYYEGCITTEDPVPRICEAVISATLEEVERISPVAKAYSFETQRDLEREIKDLSECGHRKISHYSQRMQKEFEKIVNCILSNVNA